MRSSLVATAQQLNRSTRLTTHGYIRSITQRQIPACIELQTALYVRIVNRDQFGEYKERGIQYADQCQKMTVTALGMFIICLKNILKCFAD